ncbi:MAG: hypothetical protein RLP44_29690 [Aggregatilineales bacterium]
MTKKKKSKRAFKLIAFKAYYDTDQDILDWWEGIEEGERSDAMRDLIRDQLGVVRRKSKVPIIDLPELMEVRRDTLWIKDALNDMPAYLERVIEHVITHAQSVSVGQHPPRASPPVLVDNDPALTDAESERRTWKMRKATW